ncbi:MAG: endonuclease/exonuclease/phosphatase family protein [Propionicimonas sp.]
MLESRRKNLKPRTGRGRRLVGITFACLGAALGSFAFVLGAYPHLQLSHRYLTLAASFTPYGFLAWAVAGIAILLVARAWWLLLLVPVVVMFAVQFAWTAPYWPRDPVPVAGEPVTVMTLNTYYSRVDLAQLTQRVAQESPEVVVLQEVTIATSSTIDSPQWRELLPYRIGVPNYAWYPTNMMVFSRYPLRQVVESGIEAPVHVVDVDLPGGPLRVVAVHVTNPTVDFHAWQSELAGIGDTARLSDGPTIVLGDFNAVREHEPLRQLLQGGLRSGAEVSGVGWLPTYPADGLPPLIAIDHLLVNDDVGVTAASTWRIGGTDHLGLSARLAVGR